MIRFLFILLNLMIILPGGLTLAQESRFYMANEFKQAYDRGTRSWDGKPGPNYWQNSVDYLIDISIDPPTRKITGVEDITYYNNSMESISFLVVRLYYDVYAKMRRRDRDLQDINDLSDGVKITWLSVGGEVYDLESHMISRSGTNMKIRLNNALAPGKSVSMKIGWENFIPYSNMRTGMVDSTSFFVAYWYPQVSVYDDIFGWDQLHYGGTTEFYNNLANFDVTIHVPETFTVWGTGVLQNAKKVMDNEVYNRFEKAKSSKEVIHIISSDDANKGLNHTGEGWHFKATEVSDFAFGLSDHYAWDAAIQPVEDRNVFISSVFPENRADQCADLTTLQQKTMKHFSEDVPGVPYPYPAFTTFISKDGGGMEYPMMANNGGPGRGVTVHEMFHTYFPMYVRTNEKRFAWMDEGWANLITKTVTNTYFENRPDTGIVYEAGLSNMAGRYHDLPLMISSQFTDDSNYGSLAYGTPAFVFGMLHHVLGPDVFHRCLKEYIERWAKKSPSPYDLFYTFEDVSGKDLSWFWSPWFFDFGEADVRLKSFDRKTLKIEKVGNKPVPLNIQIEYTDSDKTNNIIRSASIWENSNIFSIKPDNPKKIKMIFINEDLPDANRIDNIYPEINKYYEYLKVDKEFEGTFRIPGMRQTEYSFEYIHGILYMNSSWDGRNAVLPVSQNIYTTLEMGQVVIEFLKEDGKCTGAYISTWGRKRKAKKL